MDKELIKMMVDYFDPEDLVDFLGINTEQLIERFEDVIEECLDDITSEMHVDEEDDDDAFDSA